MKVRGFYSKEAKELACWARDEPNRIKASKIFRIAQRLDKRKQEAMEKGLIARSLPSHVVFFETLHGDVTMPIVHQDHRPPPPPPTHKPSIGLRPRKVFQEHRIMEIIAALHQYSHAGKASPEEWVAELEELLQQRFSDSF